MDVAITKTKFEPGLVAESDPLHLLDVPRLDLRVQLAGLRVLEHHVLIGQFDPTSVLENTNASSGASTQRRRPDDQPRIPCSLLKCHCNREKRPSSFSRKRKQNAEMLKRQRLSHKLEGFEGVTLASLTIF
jgi:hypothetical protein